MNRRELFAVFFSIEPGFSLVFVFIPLNAGIVEDESAILVSLLLAVLKASCIQFCIQCACAISIRSRKCLFKF